MDTKRILVSFLLVASILFLVASVSASDVGTISRVEVNGVNTVNNPVLIAGDTVTVRVDFSSLVNTSDVTVKVTIEGNKADTEAITRSFDVESGNTYSKSLSVDVPSDLRDILSDTATVTVKISGSGYKTTQDYEVRIQRPSYNADIMSVGVPQTISAGDTIPVDVVLRNNGYDNLNDLYITASIPALGIQKTGFFGDLVSLTCDKDKTSVYNYGVNVTRKCNEDAQTTLSGQLMLQIPYDIQSGIYTLELQVENGDTTSTKAVQVAINNPFSQGNFIVSGNSLLIVNPTNNVVVYRLVPQSTSSTTVSVSDSLVAVPAGSSKTVSVSADSGTTGEYNYSVNVFSADGNLVKTVDFSSTGAGTGTTSPIVVLTVILAIIFIVLLVVLIVLIGKKPSKTEEFGESYY